MRQGKETVINEELVLDCLKQQSIWLGEGEDEHPSKEVLQLRELLADPTIKITKAWSLNLSFRSILNINHLGGFQRLVKLKLDNNQISKIENISHLINLETLDLSFNKIRKIENLETLVNLHDLNLSSNEIESIEGLGSNTKLQILSLSNNKLTELTEVEGLRCFRELRVLNLAGNPIASMEDFKNTVCAFLDVEYLDYVRILPAEVTAAREEKTEYLNAIKTKELKEQEKNLEKQKIKERKQMLKDANIEGVETLFEDMIKDDSEHNRLSLLPEAANIIKPLEDQFRTVTERYIKCVLTNKKKKLKQDELFRYAYRKLCEQSETASRQLIEKAETIESIDEVDKLEYSLMEIEMHHIEQFEVMIDKYDDICDDILRFNLKQSEEIFSDLQIAQEDFLKELTKNVDRLLEIVQEEGTEKIENPALEEAQLEQMQVLLESKETTRQAVQNSHDNHVAHISKIEDQVRDREETEKKSKVIKAKEFETQRNRSRCAEIFDLAARFRAELNLEP